MPPPTPPKGGENLTGASLEKLTFIQRGRSVALKGASLHIEERLSLDERNALFICIPAIPANELLPHNTPNDILLLCKEYYLRPSPFGEGMGVRL